MFKTVDVEKFIKNNIKYCFLIFTIIFEIIIFGKNQYAYMYLIGTLLPLIYDDILYNSKTLEIKKIIDLITVVFLILNIIMAINLILEKNILLIVQGIILLALATISFFDLRLTNSITGIMLLNCYLWLTLKEKYPYIAIGLFISIFLNFLFGTIKIIPISENTIGLNQQKINRNFIKTLIITCFFFIFVIIIYTVWR